MMYWAELAACRPTQWPGRTPATRSSAPAASIAAKSSPLLQRAPRGPRIAGCFGRLATVSRNRWYRLFMLIDRKTARLPSRAGSRCDSHRLPHRPASAGDPRRGMRPAVGRQALAADPEIIYARHLEGSHGNLVGSSLRQVFHRRTSLGIPVFDRPRATYPGVGESPPLSHVVGRERVAPANPPAVAHAEPAGLGHGGLREIGTSLEETHHG